MTIRNEKPLLLLLLLLSALVTSAQQHDNIWLFGYESYNNVEGWGGSVLDFSDDTLNIYYEYRDMNLDVTNASICDTAGNLLFYTNGIYIANAVHDTMENGLELNPGEFADNHIIYGYVLDQGAMVLPVPESDSLFYLIHGNREYPDDQQELDWHASKLYYTLIDMSLNNGLGAAIEKNITIIDDVLDLGKITATKHANGRDWWILTRKYNSNGYYSTLITKDEVINYEAQEFENPFIVGKGQAVFSPDGSKYALYSIYNHSNNYLNIYDFDRCTGLLSNPIQELILDTIWSGGVAISPSSQFLYVSSYNYIYQYDLFAGDILASKDTVAVYDGFELEITPSFSLPTRFFLMQLGPDGKIYINCPTSVNFLHVINNPDAAGEACEVQQHHIELPTYNLFSLPNFPNYRLGPLPGSPCDTTTAVVEPISDKVPFSSYPNPASEVLILEFGKELQEPAEVIFYTPAGQEAIRFPVPSGVKRYPCEVNTLSQGIYFCYINRKEGPKFAQKVAIVR